MQAKKAKEPDSDSVSDSGFYLLTKNNVYSWYIGTSGAVKLLTWIAKWNYGNTKLMR